MEKSVEVESLVGQLAGLLPAAVDLVDLLDADVPELIGNPLEWLTCREHQECVRVPQGVERAVFESCACNGPTPRVISLRALIQRFAFSVGEYEP